MKLPVGPRGGETSNSEKDAGRDDHRGSEPTRIKSHIITIDFGVASATSNPSAAVAPERQPFDDFEAAIAEHFDASYYAYEYPDLTSDPVSSLRHFCRQGWYEGRNPNPFFDTVSYLDQYTDVERARINPYFHYLMFGCKEGRTVNPSVSPSVRTRLLFGRPIRELVDRLRKHVDVAYYLSQFGDVPPQEFDPVVHFAYRGWRQGKSPNPKFDTAAWMKLHPLAAHYGVNPLLIQLEADESNFQIGLLRERVVEEAVSADQNTHLTDMTFSTSIERGSSTVVTVGVDQNNYQMDLPITTAIDRETSAEAAISPDENAGATDATAPLAPAFADVQTSAELNVNAGTGAATIAQQPVADAEMAVVAGEFNRPYYLATNPDVARAGVDPLNHFFYTGWREGRNPNETFDTKYYLDVNEDVRNADINPFWHYLVSGKTEGRLPCRPGGYIRQLIDSAIVPSTREPFFSDYGDEEFDYSGFLRQLRSALKVARGLVVSLSHDCYPRVVGGTQIFISDEQQKFNENRFAYVHLSPQIIMMTLSEPFPDFMVRVVLNGKLLGLVRIGSVCDFFRVNRAKYDFDSFLIVHCLFGFHIGDVMDLKQSIRPTRCVYWLHDYSSLCEGFNLLRNDAHFCGCPPPESQACRVCVYGTNRERHRFQFDFLFKHVEFEIASPSSHALDLWTKSTSLPYQRALVHPHWSLAKKKRTTRKKKNSLQQRRSSASTEISVAFVGYASPSKGWPLFCELVRAIKHDERYKWFHFAATGVASSPDVEFVVTEVQPHNRFATKVALEKYKIDIVAILSPWPETFSFVTFEAIAAGACIVCLDTSGNVADVVRQLKAGTVLSGLENLIQFFASGGAKDMLAQREANTGYEIQDVGTSATIAEIADLARAAQRGKRRNSIKSRSG